MTTVAWILLGCSALALFMWLLGIGATIRHTTRPPFSVPADRLPPISVLKPIKGAEEGLEENLRSFYRQDYPGDREVVFATTEPDDAALPIARKIAAEFPEVPTRFVHS